MAIQVEESLAETLNAERKFVSQTGKISAEAKKRGKKAWSRNKLRRHRNIGERGSLTLVRKGLAKLPKH